MDTSSNDKVKCTAQSKSTGDIAKEGSDHGCESQSSSCIQVVENTEQLSLEAWTGMQEMHIGDKHIHTSGSVYNAQVVMQNPIVMMNAGHCGTLLAEIKETAVKLPVTSIQDNQPLSNVDQICQNLKSSLNERVKTIASEESSLAEFSQQPITPVDLAIVGQPQRLNEKYTARKTDNTHRKDVEVTYSEETGEEISFEQLFTQAKLAAENESRQKFPSSNPDARREYVEKHGNVVGVVGPTGIGKTTSSKNWALKALCGEIFQPVSFIFYIVVRLIAFREKMTFLHFLLSTLLPDWKCVSNVTHDILTAIAEDRDVLLIFDGLDKADFESFSTSVPLPPLYAKSKPENFLKHLAGGNILPRARKIFTSRPDQMYKLHPLYRPKFIVQILGLTPKSQDQLGRQICGPTYTHIREQMVLNSNTQAFCRVPANFVLTLNFLMNSSEKIQPVSLTRILTFTSCQYSRTGHMKSQECQFAELSTLAWNGLLDKKLVFYPHDFQKLRIRIRSVDTFLVTSIAKQANLKHQILSHDKACHFSHLIWQEYFAAVYIMLLMPFKKFKGHYKQLCEMDRWEVVVKFSLGISAAVSVLHELKHLVAGCSLDDLGRKTSLLKEHILTLLKQRNKDDVVKRVLSWTREAEDPDMTSRVSDYLTDRIERSFAQILPTDVENLSFVLQADRNTRVKTLDLSWNNVGLLGASSLTRCLHNINSLILRHSDIDCRAVDKLSEAISALPRSMMVLDLSWNLIGDAGASYLSRCVHNVNLLILCHSHIGAEGVKHLTNAITNLCFPMKRLNLSGNKIGDDGAISLAGCVHNLKMLELVDCGIANSGAQIIFEKLQAVPAPMECLKLSYNPGITDDCLSSLLGCTDNLKIVHISWCSLTDNGKKILAAKSHQNCSLTF